jgi:phytoene dehydrogenase-like protein
MLEHSIEATVATLDACDASRYRSLIAPVTSKFAELSEDILGPIQHVPRHPFVLARFASSALQSAASLARSHFTGKRAQAFFAGMATHSALSLEAPASAAVALTLMAAGHANGWPILRGGAQALPDALAQHLEDLGGRIEINHENYTTPGGWPDSRRHHSPTTSSQGRLSTAVALLQAAGALPLWRRRLQD